MKIVIMKMDPKKAGKVFILNRSFSSLNKKIKHARRVLVLFYIEK